MLLSLPLDKLSQLGILLWTPGERPDRGDVAQFKVASMSLLLSHANRSANRGPAEAFALSNKTAQMCILGKSDKDSGLDIIYRRSYEETYHFIGPITRVNAAR